MSILKVQQLQHTNGTVGLDINTSGSVHMPGHVVQAIYSETDSRASYTSTSFVDVTGMTATITPKYNTSKILVQVCMNIGIQNAAFNLSCTLFRGSTAIFAGTDTSNKQGFVQIEGNTTGGQYKIYNQTATTLDSPASSSAVVYKVMGRINTSAGTWYLNRNHYNAGDQGNTKSSMTLLEIAQ